MAPQSPLLARRQTFPARAFRTSPTLRGNPWSPLACLPDTPWQGLATTQNPLWTDPQAWRIAQGPLITGTLCPTQTMAWTGTTTHTVNWQRPMEVAFCVFDQSHLPVSTWLALFPPSVCFWCSSPALSFASVCFAWRLTMACSGCTSLKTTPPPHFI